MKTLNRNSAWRLHGSGILAKLAGVLLVVAGLSGCKEEENRYVAPPPPKVTVSHPLVQPLTEYLDMTGNTQAVELVQLKARVKGFLTQIGFKDGDVVKKDATLFVIEPPPYEAKVKLAEANVASAKARLLRASQEYKRQQQLIRQSATSQSEVEKWQAEQDAAQASLDESKANLEIARINLGYTTIKAPFLGRMDRHLVDIGNLVGSGGATLLSTIYRLDPIYAYFNVNEKDLVRAMEKDKEDGKRDLAPFPVYLAIEGEKGYPHKGKLDFAATALDSSTGTLLLRGIFDNPLQGGIPKMLPGMFVRVRIPVDTIPEALFVSNRSVGVDQRGTYVLVVNDKNVVEQRTVRLGPLVEGNRAVLEGLHKEDWVVTNGIQRARPGAEVTPIRENAGPPPAKTPSEPKADVKSGEHQKEKPEAQSQKTASSPKR
ncbi:MAG: efflux RND transporter periplasmic adaptor subunit [Candidatus Desulfacyla sp.]